MKDNTVKNWWLAILVFKNFLIPIFFIISLMGTRWGTKVFENPGISLFHFIFSLALIPCAYKKPGTRLLTYCIFCEIVFGIPLSMLVIILSHTIPQLDITHFGSLYFILLMEIVFIFLSIKLRKINKKSQLEQILANSEYHTLFQHMQAATSQEDLCLRYSEATKKSPEIAWHIKRAFKEKNTQLVSQ